MNKVIKIFRDIFLFVLGLLISLFFLTFVLLSIPVYIYRWILCRIVAPCFHPRIGKAVTSFGVSFGSDYVSQDFYKKASRSTLVSHSTIHGTVTFDEVVEYLQTLVKLSEIERTGPRRILRFPELQQYVESWMGFLFWKQDPHFNLANHVKLHEIDESSTDQEAEQFVIQVIEDLLNKPFVPKRSPWEVHVIHGYRNDKLKKLVKDDSDQMTLAILRSHHVLADGFALLSALLEGVLGAPSSTVFKIPVQLQPQKSVCKSILTCLQFPVRFFYDIGCACAYEYKPQMNSPWHCSDSKKKWKNFHGRSELIPVDKIAFIKNNFGVSFTSVLYCCMSGALSKYLEGKAEKKYVRFREKVKYLPVAATLNSAMPIRDKMRNRFTASIVDLPIRHGLSPNDRLLLCEKSYDDAKEKILPCITPFFIQALGSHLVAVTNKLMVNKGLSSDLSNFIGPNIPLDFQGQRIVSGGFAFSNCSGVSGLGFQIMSYAGFVQIAATAERGVLAGRDELNQILDFACGELDALYELALKDNNRSVALDMPSA